MTGTPTWGAGNGAGTTGDTGGTVKQAADTARSEGAEVAHTAAEAGSQVASTAADATKEVAGEARRQARDLYGEARSQLQQQAGATQRQAAGGVRSVADELRQMAGPATAARSPTWPTRRRAAPRTSPAGWSSANPATSSTTYGGSPGAAPARSSPVPHWPACSPDV